jgi:hypothetical protein
VASRKGYARKRATLNYVLRALCGAGRRLHEGAIASETMCRC